MEIFTQIVGWVGTCMIVFAYILVSLKKVDGTNHFYQLLNLFGAIGLAINVYHQKSWPAFALEIVWGLIAVLGLLKRHREDHKSQVGE
jgi:hypothetical protein